MVNKKSVPFILQLAVLPQGSGNGLALLPGVDKDQTFFAPGMFVDIPDTGVSVLRCFRGLFLQNGKGIRYIFSLSSLHVFHIEVLHTQTPFVSLSFDLGDDGLPPGSHGEKFSGSLRVANGGR